MKVSEIESDLDVYFPAGNLFAHTISSILSLDSIISLIAILRRHDSSKNGWLFFRKNAGTSRRLARSEWLALIAVARATESNELGQSASWGKNQVRLFCIHCHASWHVADLIDVVGRVRGGQKSAHPRIRAFHQRRVGRGRGRGRDRGGHHLDRRNDVEDIGRDPLQDMFQRK